MHAELALTVLCNNEAIHGLMAEHGLAIWLSTGPHNWLFDCGSGETLQHNAEQLHIPLGACKQVILSHGHQDHTGGLAILWQQGIVPVLAHPDVTLPRYSRHPDKPVRSIGMPSTVVSQLWQLPEHYRQWSTKAVRLNAWMGTSGVIPRCLPYEDTGGPFFLDAAGFQVDGLQDDQALWINTVEGLIVLLGCCHSGLINTIARLRQLTGIQRIAGIIGGLHLLHASQERLHHTLTALASIAPDFMYLGHCTGNEIIPRLQQALPHTRIEALAAGCRYRFTPSPLSEAANKDDL